MTDAFQNIAARTKVSSVSNWFHFNSCATANKGNKYIWYLVRQRDSLTLKNDYFRKYEELTHKTA